MGVCRRNRISRKTNMNTSTEVLTVGQMTTMAYDGGLNIHVYNTCDPIDDQVIILEKQKRAVVIELPCFRNTIEAITEWLGRSGITVEAKLVSYHAAGSSFLPEVRSLMTPSAQQYNFVGGGKGLVTNFEGVFGDAFDGSMPESTVLDAGPVSIAGIDIVIVPNDEAYEVEIPQVKAVYMHMLGHDCHSIVAGAGHADAIIGNLRQYLDRGFETFFSAHYAPETRQDVETKIDYLRGLKEIASGSADADSFKAAVNERYPGYSGANYLDITAGIFFPQ